MFNILYTVHISGPSTTTPPSADEKGRSGRAQTKGAVELISGMLAEFEPGCFNSAESTSFLQCF